MAADEEPPKEKEKEKEVPQSAEIDREDAVGLGVVGVTVGSKDGGGATASAAQNPTTTQQQEDNDAKMKAKIAEETVEADEFGLPVRPKKDKDKSEDAPKDAAGAAGESSSTKPDNADAEGEPVPLTPLSPELAQLPASDILHGNTGVVSGHSHQVMAPRKKDKGDGNQEDEEWKVMPAYARFDMYDDNNKLVAKEAPDSDQEDEDKDDNAYQGLGGAGKGYTRVQLDEDAQSATSMDENTDYLFKNKGTDVIDEDEEARDPLAQLQATKGLLTEGQRIAYVGLVRLSLAQMVGELEAMPTTRGTKKILGMAGESAKLWSQMMMVRLYSHMEISASEQIMIEQLQEHGVQPKDLTPPLMLNARVKNPMAEQGADDKESLVSPRTVVLPMPKSPGPGSLTEAIKAAEFDQEAEEAAPAADTDLSKSTQGQPSSQAHDEKNDPSKAPETALGESSEHPPAYEESTQNNPMPEPQTPTHLGTSKNIDIDLRWTILCDLFLVLLADSVYDARSRTLLERVGEALEVSWLDICRFEKRATEALEMEESAQKETWDEAEHMESRRKMALKRKYMMMGLATVGGSLVIGLSAGLLAPVIGAGLAAGFSTIGIAGTSGFLAGTAGTAIITSGSVVAGASMAIKASHRRTGAVSTFEYRPLHNNKRVNLIITISGWMNGKVDDVRLPYSTVDPVMGDMYSVLWEPEMLQSTGQTITILATEALTQGLQHVLGTTILTALMGALQLPIVLSKLTYLIDNPWSVSMARANAAGLVFADSLIDRNLGARPITLVGFSLGARVIFAALRELANKGAFGLVQNVYLFGSPVVANRDEYLRARSVVSGRFVNGFASNDWILGYLFRATAGGIMRVAGLAPVEKVPGIENQDVTKHVNGHMAYRAAMPKLLRLCGWEVMSDEFAEIEDPDPEDHSTRQRELIRELNEARNQAKEEPQKRRFGLFSKGKLARRKGWETYDDSSAEGGDDDFSTKAAEGLGGNVLFDIEAIRRELYSEQIEVRQLESTLPPMKIEIGSPDASGNPKSPPTNLRETKSYNDGLTSTSSAAAAKGSKSPLSNPFDKGYDEYNVSEEAIASPSDAVTGNSKGDVASGTFPPAVHPKSPSLTEAVYTHDNGAAFSAPRRPSSGGVDVSKAWPTNAPAPSLPFPSLSSPSYAMHSPPTGSDYQAFSPRTDASGPVEHNAWTSDEETDLHDGMNRGEESIQMSF